MSIEKENPSDKIGNFHVAKVEDGTRLDKWLLKTFPNLNNSIVQKLIRTGQVRVNGKRYKFNDLLKFQDVIRVPLFIVNQFVKEDNHKPQVNILKYQKQIDEIVNSVIYKDEDFLIINKPYNLAVQGGTKVTFNLTNAFEALAFEKENLPHIVHRIDKETSGVLVLARHKEASVYASNLFQNGMVNKTYYCLVYPCLKKGSGVIREPLMKIGNLDNQRIVIDADGKDSITEYKVIDVNNQIGLMEAKPITGRTHQIRVHMAYSLKSAIVGDFKYGFKATTEIPFVIKRLYLHASKISFLGMHGKQIIVSAPMDANFLEAISQLDMKI